MNEKNVNEYFIEESTNKDLIGFNSYVTSLETAIKSGAKFIGLISDFGTGKSSVVKMLKNKMESEYNMITINLWNCEDNEHSGLNIHEIFLHKLIDELDIKSKKYYKNLINKRYRKFDISVCKEKLRYIVFLVVYIFMLIFEKIEMIDLFICDFQKFMVYFGVSFLIVFCIMIYKPILSFSKDNTDIDIDENDTKDLYLSIMSEYFNINNRIKAFDKLIRKNEIKKPLIISLEEIDRYNNTQEVIKYLKEFYKFYKLTSDDINCKKGIDVVFITGIKPSSKLINEESKEKKTEAIKIKNIYEKIFDFILNLNRINVNDYGEFISGIISSENIKLPANVDYPNETNMKKWRYIYLGEKTTIRDIKHRFNFAISLYKSVEESGIPNVDFYKCIFISYLEDSYNELYGFLIDNPKIFNDIIISFSEEENKEKIRSICTGKYELSEDELDVLIEGIQSNLISVDYVYYFYKYPKNKKSYNAYELALYHAITFDESSETLETALNYIDEVTIEEILNKRKNIAIYPKVVFNYPKILKVAYNSNQKTLLSTLLLNYDLISNYNDFEEIVKKMRSLKKPEFMDAFSFYFERKKKLILEANMDQKEKLRLNLVKLFGPESKLFDYMFKNDNPMIKLEEMKAINNFSVIKELSNYYIINEEYINNISNYINQTSKTNVIAFLKELSLLKELEKELFKKIIYNIDFNKYLLSENDIKRIYNIVQEKLELNNSDNLIELIFKLNKLNDFLNSKLLSLLDSNNKDDQIKYIKVCEKNNYASKSSVEFINKYTYYLELPKVLDDKMFEEKYYEYYVMSKLYKGKVYSIEEDKFEKLKHAYVKKFEDLKSWKYSVEPKMAEYLYKNVDFNKLSKEKLNVFVNQIQNKEIIKSIINTGDNTFINKYLKMIKNILKKDEKEIYEILGNYYKKEDLEYKTRKNLKKLTNIKLLKNLLDGRKNK